MAPVKISYTVGGKERGSITAPEDRTSAVLDTPVGKVEAHMSPPGRIMRAIKRRFVTTNLPFDDVGNRLWIFKERNDPLIRTHETKEGKVEIKVEVVGKNEGEPRL